MISQNTKGLLLVSDQEQRHRDVIASSGFTVKVLTHREIADRYDSLSLFLDDFSGVVLDEQSGTPDRSGTLRLIRSQSQIPVVCVSQSDEVTDCVVALELGADDFIRHPVSSAEISARIRAILRRTSRSSRRLKDRLVADDIEVSIGQRVVERDGEPVELTGVEFELLVLLLKSKGHIVSRDTIARSVLGQERHISNRSIDVHISGLRKKLGESKNGDDRIKTVRGSGYVYVSSAGP